MNALPHRSVITLALVVLVAGGAMALKMHSFRTVQREVEKSKRVVGDIRALAAEFEKFKEVTGSYPPTAQLLRAVPNRPKDPWGSEYVYRCPGIHHPDGYDLFSAGADLTPDTSDDHWGEE